MTTLASAILDKAVSTLYDETSVIWNRTVLFNALNEAIGNAAGIRKDIYTRTNSIALTANTVKQAIPADAVVLVNVTRNMGAAGAVPGAAITQVDKETMDRVSPSWTTDTAAAAVIHYMYNPTEPRTLYVWPMPATAFSVEEVLSYVPPDLTAESDAIPIDDIWEQAILFYVISRAYEKRNEDGDLGKSDAYMKRFRDELSTEEVGRLKIIADESRPK